MNSSSTIASSLERDLTLDILRGTYAPGSRLPTVRELAARFSVNPSTVQRVVARLETRGLVTARQGSGLRINDPHEVGDLSLLPFWLEATVEDPERAAQILDEFLELRRVAVARLVVRHRERLLASLDELAALATAMTTAKHEGVAALAEADIAFARAFLRKTNNTIALAMFSSLAAALRAMPLVAEAMYSKPETNLASMLEILEAARRPTDDLGAVVEGAIESVDRATVRRFKSLLKRSKRERQHVVG